MITRAEVVKEAMSWLGTPYRLGGMVKGAGVDCATFLYCVYKICGIIRDGDQFIERYSHDWFRNTNQERYGLRALLYAHKVAEGVCNRSLRPEPGNYALSKAAGSKVWNHGGIVVAWPTLIHTVYEGVQIANAFDHEHWQYREVVILDPWLKEAEAVA